jgi:xanthine dehydrogenase accessory factor
MTADVLSQLVDAINRGEAVALVTVTGGSGVYAQELGAHCLVWLDASHECAGDLGLGELTEAVLQDARNAIVERRHSNLTYSTAGGDVHLFVEVQGKPPHLIIVGAGHIAVPLASVASICDFEVTVLDDRPMYANAERFPTADRVIAGPMVDELRTLRASGRGLDADTYVVLVTRGHSHDVECLVELIDDPLAYVGMIGSRRRIDAVLQLLESEKGLAAERLDGVHAPIGLDIGARTPAEIAVCIMAEIINVMRGGSAVSISELRRRERMDRRERARVNAAR